MKYAVFTIIVMALHLAACKKQTTVTSPRLVTLPFSNVTSKGATANGIITSNGGTPITKSGIVWSKTNNAPTISDSSFSGTTATGSFAFNLTNLDFNTNYYIRAFATNSSGTGYGDVVTLHTLNDTDKVRFTYMGETVVYGVLTSPITGKKWMDRNLGASRVATASDDSLAFGHYFQWGRLADGHQVKTSGTTTTLSSTDAPGHNKYIIPTSNSDRDWRSPANDNFWQGSSGVNNPCPAGWHVPTKAEWEAETITTVSVAFNQLKLSLGGQRNYLLQGGINEFGTAGYYWTSTTETVNAYAMILASSFAGTASSRRGHAAAIRCIKD